MSHVKFIHHISSKLNDILIKIAENSGNAFKWSSALKAIKQNYRIRMEKWTGNPTNFTVPRGSPLSKFFRPDHLIKITKLIKLFQCLISLRYSNCLQLSHIFLDLCFCNIAIRVDITIIVGLTNGKLSLFFSRFTTILLIPINRFSFLRPEKIKTTCNCTWSDLHKQGTDFWIIIIKSHIFRHWAPWTAKQITSLCISQYYSSWKLY